MSNNEKNKINSERIIRALKNWSPNGLCSGTLVQKNGDPAKTEACAIGCLSLEFIKSKPGKNFFKKHKTGGVKAFVSRHLYDEATLGWHAQEFTEAMQKYYGIDNDLMDAMMNYNDSCVVNKGEVNKAYHHDTVPAKVRNTIYSLRKRFVKWAEKEQKRLAKLGKMEEDEEYPGA